MNEVIEPLTFSELAADGRTARHVRAADRPDARQTWMPRPAALGAKQRWSTSLCEPDLQCLLNVIETELIPQLISGYSPARYSPQV